jgi:hypothetical protein
MCHVARLLIGRPEGNDNLSRAAALASQSIFDLSLGKNRCRGAEIPRGSTRHRVHISLHALSDQ